MKRKLPIILFSLFTIVPLFAHASILGIATQSDISKLELEVAQLTNIVSDLEQLVKEKLVGGLGFGNATNPIGGTNYFLAGSGISGSATSITLTSLKIPQTGALITGAMLSTNFYVTLEPGSTARQEFASCTTVTQNANGSATLSGCTRGLLPFSPYTASSTYQFPHGGGTTLIFSNTPQFYNEFAALGNAETITGLWTFPSSSPPLFGSTPTFTNGLQIIDKAYADGVASSGAADAGIGTKGLIAIGTLATAATSTDGSSVLYNLPSRQYYATSSQGATSTVIIANNGQLDSSFVSSTSYTYNAGTTQTYNSAVALNATTSISTSIASSSSLLGTNASSNLATVGSGASTGTLLQYYNGKWNAGISKTFATSSGSIASTSLVSVATTTLQTAGIGSIYNFTYVYTVTPNSNTESSTLVISNGNGSTQIAACDNGNSAAPYTQSISGQIVMQNSTSSEVLSLVEESANCTSAGNVRTAVTYLNIDLSTSTAINLKIRGSSAAGTWTATSSVYMIQ